MKMENEKTSKTPTWKRVNIVFDEEAPSLQSTLEDWMGLEEGTMNLRTRCREYVAAREIFCYVVREFTGIGVSTLGRYLERDHATVLHCLHNVESRMEVDARYRREVLRLMKMVEDGKVSVPSIKSLMRGKKRNENLM